MKLWNRNPESLQFARMVNKIPRRRSNATLIVKATYKLVPDGVAEPITPVQDPPPPVDQTPPELKPDLPSGDLPAGGDTPLGEIPAELIAYASDFVPYKPRGEVVVIGTAHTPNSRSVRGLEVKIQVGPVRKDLWVIGDHEWVDGRKTDIRPFTAMPLGYDRAYGGAGYAQNPAGKGFAVVSADNGARYRPMPNLHRPDRVADDPYVPSEPVALGPIPASWPQRRDRKMGTYDQAWLDSRWPWFPADFDWSHFNAAPTDQQIDGYWRGDEDMAFLNLHPDHSLFRTRLPGLRVRCFWKESVKPPTSSEDDGEATLPGIGRSAKEAADSDRAAIQSPPALPTPTGEPEAKLVSSPDDTLRRIRPAAARRSSAAGGHPDDTLVAGVDSDDTLGRQAPTTTGAPEAAPTPVPKPPPLDAVPAESVDAASVPSPSNFAEALGKPTFDETDAPSAKPRRKEKAAPAPEPFYWREARLVLDTINVDMDAGKVMLIWRGSAEFRSLKQREIGDVLVMTEPLDAPDHPPEHYLGLLEQQKAALDALFDSPEGEDDVPLEDLEAHIDAEIARGKADLDKAQALAEVEKARYPKVAPPAAGDPPPSAPPSEAEIDRIATEAGKGDPVQTDRIRAELRATAAGKPLAEGPGAKEAAAKKAELDQMEKDTLARIATAMAPHFGEIDGPRFETTEDFIRAVREGADLRAADLSGLDLSNLDLTGIDLTNADFLRAKLDGTRLHNAKLTGASFAMASAVGADFRGATLNQANFFAADLKTARFADASIESTNFGERDLQQADFSGCRGEGPNFAKADLTGAQFCSADLPKAIFHEAKLDDADFTAARIDKAHFMSVSARRILLRGAQMPNLRAMDGADFSDARAAGLVAPDANLTQARLVGADLRSAVLTDSLLNEIDAEAADFDGAILTGCDFQEARLVRATLTHANLLRASFDRTDLTECNLSGSNLYRAFVHEVVLGQTVVADTNLKGTLLEEHG